MLAWLGRVVVLLVGVVGLNSGLTVYREGKNTERQISKQDMAFMQYKQDDGMTSLKDLKLVLNKKEAN